MSIRQDQRVWLDRHGTPETGVASIGRGLPLNVLTRMRGHLHDEVGECIQRLVGISVSMFGVLLKFYEGFIILQLS